MMVRLLEPAENQSIDGGLGLSASNRIYLDSDNYCSNPEFRAPEPLGNGFPFHSMLFMSNENFD